MICKTVYRDLEDRFSAKPKRRQANRRRKYIKSIKYETTTCNAAGAALC